ncbi:MAG TPA: isochorismatase family protein [Gemmatimonadaceae bacterium]|jgi:nicotinamidase-related amidase
MSAIEIAPRTTALVLIDLQRGIAGGVTAPHTAAQVVERASRIARACRGAGLLVVLVRVDVGPAGILFPFVSADIPRPAFTAGEGWADIVPELGPEPGDVVVTKHQPNAFFGTDLDVHLSRRGVRTIILGGISTNIGVEATARSANERGYNQIFVEDAMAAREVDLHEFPTRRYFPTIGHVRSTDEVLAAVRAIGE